MSLDKMKSIVREQLVIIDEILSIRESPLILRPLEAAVFFVQEVIVEIKGQDKNDFYDKKWFADIYQWVEEWYVERYGDAIKRKDNDYLKGVCIIFGMPFALHIPITLLEPNDDETAWVKFPNTVSLEEEPFDWIQSKPNIGQLTEEQVSELNRTIIYIAESLRTISLNISTADIDDPSMRMLADGINGHLDKAANDILSGKKEQIAAAFWEIHMSVEKSIKVFLKQNRLSAPKSHDISYLRKLASSKIDDSSLSGSFSSLPSEKEAINFRYGEGQNPTTESAFSLYKDALNIVNFYTESLHRKIRMYNASFLIKKLPWAEKSYKALQATPKSGAPEL